VHLAAALAFCDAATSFQHPEAKQTSNVSMRCDFQKCSIRSVDEFRIAQNSPYVCHSLADVFEIGALGDLLDDLVVALVAVTPVSPSWAESQHVDGEVLHEVVLGLPMRFELGVVAILLLPILGHLQCIRVEQ
jgi:hypothetical protein